MISTQDKLSAVRGDRDPIPRFVDIHCHCLPGLDDGPATLQDSVALCQALVTDGIDRVIATPHQLGRFDGQSCPRAIRAAANTLNAALKTQGIDIEVSIGADVRLDERMPRLIDEGKVLTLAEGRRHLLLEMPHSVFIDLGPLLAQLATRDVTVILSHPERHSSLQVRPELVFPWLRKGVLLQITAGSLLGDFGPDAEATAWHLLSWNMAAFVATDAHDTQARRPRMLEAFQAVREKLGPKVACRLFADNPGRVLSGQEMCYTAGPQGLGRDE